MHEQEETPKYSLIYVFDVGCLHLTHNLDLDHFFYLYVSQYFCAAHEIKKEHGSDGKSYADSDGFGMSLATTAIFDTSGNEPRTKVRILLGTLAKACLEPSE